MAIDKIQRVPGLLQLEFVEDDTVTWQLTFVDANSDAIDLSARAYSAQVITPRDVQAAAITVDTTNAATGILQLTIDNSLTDGLGGDKLRWELVETNGGEPKTLLSGPCVVHKPGYGGTPSTPTNAATVQYVSDTTVTVTATDLSSVAGPLGGGTDVTITTPADDDLLAYDSGSGDWINQSKTEAGFGTIATQDANNVAITGGSVTGITDVTVADGGTGASTAAGARSNLDVYSTAEVDSAIDTDVATHNAVTTSVHGIADTSALETATGAQAKADAAQSAAEATAAGALASHEADTTAVHGIADTSALLDTADIGVTVQAHSAVLDATTASFTTADESKLDGIEAGADVTDATNVDAAGAVMEADYNANTVLAATTDNTPAALTVGEQTVVGRITGGNIAALTPTQIRTLINVEDGADVTDATNVDAAGAVMNSDTSTASMSFVVDEDNMASDSATKVPTQQSVKAYADAVDSKVDRFDVVVDYGAAGDGATDDTTAIQNAINAAEAAGGGVVYFPTGTYLISSTLTVDDHAVALTGAGPTSVDPGVAPVKILADTGFSSKMIRMVNVWGGEVKGLHLDMSDCAAGAEGLAVEGCYRGMFERVAVDDIPASCTGFAIRGSATAGCFWHIWRHCYAQGDSTVAAGSRAGVGWLIEDDGTGTYVVNQQLFQNCGAYFTLTGWDINNPGAGMLWDNCNAEAGNTSTGVGIDVSGTFELEYDLVWRGGEINNYATGVTGNVRLVDAPNLSSTARTSGAMSEYVYDNIKRTIYSTDDWRDRIEETNGQFSTPIAGTVTQQTSVTSGAGATTVLTLPGDQTGNLHSGLLFVTVQCTTSLWKNVRDVYHLTTYWDGSGSGTLHLVNRVEDTAVGGLAVTFTHDGTDWVVQVAQTSGETARVYAHFTGLLPA